MPHLLFVCTGNSCRSIMAEALLNHMGGGRFTASSGGTYPSGFIFPAALEILRKYHVPTEGLVSGSVEEALITPADIIITVCDRAASEPCPVAAGSIPRAHWNIPDPAAIEGNEAMRRDACDTVYHRLHTLLTQVMALPWDEASPEALAPKITRLDTH